MPQQLSAKEQSLFRTVVRNYEDKQYKKGPQAWSGRFAQQMLTTHRHQSCGPDPEEESQAWGYAGHESSHHELPGEDRRSLCTC
jgi:hypothetical protein